MVGAVDYNSVGNDEVFLFCSLFTKLENVAVIDVGDFVVVWGVYVTMFEFLNKGLEYLFMLLPGWLVELDSSQHGLEQKDKWQSTKSMQETT